MKSLRTVNLRVQRRWRGAYPLARYALNDAGELLLAVPRPLEPRVYDITRVETDGAIRVEGRVTVETLRKLEITARAQMGLTFDDVYLFREEKIRFMDEFRLVYIDATMSADGDKIAVGFSDLAGANCAVAFGESGGRQLWQRDVPGTLTTLCLSRDGSALLFGLEDGAVCLCDAARRDIYRFEQSEPVRALACSKDASYSVYGTSNGTVALVDRDGSRRWQVALNGEVTALAISEAGDFCVALAAIPDRGMRIVCLVEGGQVGWQLDTSARLTALTMSPDGRLFAASASDGTVSVYEAVAGGLSPEHAGRTSSPAADACAAATAEEASGNAKGALQLLRDTLIEEPDSALLAESLARLQQREIERALTAAAAADAAGQLAEAVRILDEARLQFPEEEPVLHALNGAKRVLAADLKEQAEEHLAAGREDEAEHALLAAIEAAPLETALRSRLCELYTLRAAGAEEEAEAMLAEGSYEAGIELLETTQKLRPSEAVARRLFSAQVAREFSRGMELYNEKKYPEAAFEFNKVLARVPDHAEAKRYLNYALKFSRDNASASLADRFSRLE